MISPLIHIPIKPYTFDMINYKKLIDKFYSGEFESEKEFNVMKGHLIGGSLNISNSSPNEKSIFLRNLTFDEYKQGKIKKCP